MTREAKALTCPSGAVFSLLRSQGAVAVLEPGHCVMGRAHVVCSRPLGRGMLSGTEERNTTVPVGPSRPSSFTHLEAAPATVTCS